MPRKVIFTTLGSLGDLHPYIAVAVEMKRRGYECVVATSEIYRQKVEGEGLRFHPLRPDMSWIMGNQKAMRQLNHPWRGTENVLRKAVLPFLEESYTDLLAIAEGADLLVSHLITFATPMVAEKLNLKWVSTILQPSGFFSAFDPPTLPQLALVNRISSVYPMVRPFLFREMKRISRSWFRPVDELRSRVGLPPSNGHPLFEGAFSPYGTIALYSRVLGGPQPDWPAKTAITGFPFYDRLLPGEDELPAELKNFLDRGEPPIVFTLGSSAVFDPGEFYEQSREAARLLGKRAILLAGKEYQKRIRLASTEEILIVDYAPFSVLFPRAAAIVHQGGVGTTGQVLRAGRPMLVVPFSHDQPDNAARVVKLGVARTLARKNYSAQTAARKLEKLLNDSATGEQAQRIGEQVQKEDGARVAADLLEDCLG